MPEKESGRTYYSPVPGSRSLATGAPGKVETLRRIERADKSKPLEVEFSGERLAVGLDNRGFPVELFDATMAGVDPVEQAVFGHLYRLSHGEGADWVRVGMKDLEARTTLSQRRLLKALSGLTERGLIKPLHRDTTGTLYKIYSRQKVYSSRPVQERETRVEPAPSVAPPREKTIESPINDEVFARGKKVLTMREIATEFFETIGRKPSDTDMDSALSHITLLLEDGFTRDEARRTALYLAKSFGKKADISQLPYYVRQVVEKNGQSG